MVAGERDRPDVARRRAQWIKYQDRIDPARLVFIDETWTKTNMAPLRGWAPRGSRLIAKVPHGRWRTMTFLAALRHDRIDAPWLLDGPIDGESFPAYVEKVLLPTLRPGDIVIMDNLGSHKGKIVRQLIRSAGAKLFFLPKYSPDLNPIEQVFAKLKHLLRKAAARTVETVCAAIGELARRLHQERMRQLFQKLRICPNLNASRFRRYCLRRKHAPFDDPILDQNRRVLSSLGQFEQLDHPRDFSPRRRSAAPL